MLSLERGSDVNAIIHEIKKELFNHRLFAAIMRKQLQMENPVPRLTNQYAALMDKLTTTSVNSVEQLSKHLKAVFGIASLV